MDEKASETCRVLLQLLINILPSCITLVLYIYHLSQLHVVLSRRQCNSHLLIPVTTVLNMVSSKVPNKIKCMQIGVDTF